MRLVVLAGAGCSTESGIPDYRGATAQPRRRAPLQYGEFVSEPSARTRYWARSSVGWPRIRAAQPNAAHFALAQLESAGRVCGIITQNVDRLHHAAGSRRVIELHGALEKVLCLGCGEVVDRDAVQRRIEAENPEWARRYAGIGAMAPDGDAELPDEFERSFSVPACAACGGTLKPDVVFFGENVPKPRVERAWSLYDEADALVVVGSSLTVYSGFRFVKRAAEDRKPIVIVNIGPTRGDELAWVKLDEDVSKVLPALVAALG